MVAQLAFMLSLVMLAAVGAVTAAIVAAYFILRELEV